MEILFTMEKQIENQCEKLSKTKILNVYFTPVINYLEKNIPNDCYFMTPNGNLVA